MLEASSSVVDELPVKKENSSGNISKYLFLLKEYKIFLSQSLQLLLYYKKKFIYKNTKMEKMC